MKKIIGFIVMMIPLVTFSQFDIDYSPNTNIMTVEYNGCDFCRYGNIFGLLGCLCRKECDDQLESDALLQYYQCKEECEEFITEPSGYAACIEDCDFLLKPLEDCKKECSPPAIPLRTVVGYDYRLVVDWANIPYDPRNSDTNRHETGWSGVIASSTINIPPWTVVSPWPEIYSGHNTCYGIEIVIFYDDGIACLFKPWYCHIIG